jgi:hypothetical protein
MSSQCETSVERGVKAALVSLMSGRWPVARMSTVSRHMPCRVEPKSSNDVTPAEVAALTDVIDLARCYGVLDPWATSDQLAAELTGAGFSVTTNWPHSEHQATATGIFSSKAEQGCWASKPRIVRTQVQPPG